MTDWIQLEAERYFRVAKRMPIVIERGEGVWVWDTDGKRYLDFIGGWAVNTLGHCHPLMIEALTKQAKTLLLASNQVYTVPQLELADLLVKHSPMDRVFIGNSGAEANEGAVKLARKYGKKVLNGAYKVVSMDHSFHGRTLSMVAATGKPAYQKDFTPLPEGFQNIPFNDIDALEQACDNTTAAVMLEVVQGEGGVIEADPTYLRQVRELCTAKKILFIADEVQTGVGRLGTLWGHTQFGIEPDVMTLAKGLGGGVPVGAFLAKEEFSVLEFGDHGSTYGGNALVCAVAAAVFRYVVEQDLSAHVASVSEHLKSALSGLRSKYPFITDVRGRGFLLAVEFEQDIAADILTAALARGFILNSPLPNAIRMMPPLVLTEAEADEAVALLDASIEAAVA
ncbi:MAG: aspartate aminotransferase family protein [Chloroflexota bacterium]